MKRIILVKTILLLVSIGVVTLTLSCNGSDEQTVIVNESIQPKEVLPEIPVYTGAEVVRTEESEFEPFSTPHTFQSGPFDIVYETVSIQYMVQAEAKKVLKWYKNKLSGKGYRLYTEMTYNGPGGTDVDSMGFYRSDYPLISVEIHVYEDLDTAIFALMISRDTTTSLEPHELPLPDDIIQIDISYTGDQDNPEEKKETITDEGDIKRLVDIANNLSPYAYGPPGAIGPPTFSIMFHSVSTGAIPLEYKTGFDKYAVVRIDNSEYRDNDGKLLKVVKRILDI